ncbi:hypothetical protein [Chondrinema litorale]|uniref:hypothetical protein n=1 Tax=Chondrinema litorale TaxID=2994555 RepID=UPI0025426F19|nr:hypothetical protein [Chondrinema litorale]UZR93160.1 hypothetical protein OQ292_14970 [Chondrinema litorale]
MALKSKEHIGIELEFLFRQQLQLQAQLANYLSQELTNQVFQLYIAASFRTFYLNKDDERIELEQLPLEADPNYLKAAQLIEEAFNILNHELYEFNLSGLPITITLGQGELLIKDHIETLSKAIHELLS